MRYKVVFVCNGKIREITFNGYDEEEKANFFKKEYIRMGYNDVKIETY
jgi:hypothetical protein